jgi:hypothetical protein
MQERLTNLLRKAKIDPRRLAFWKKKTADEAGAETPNAAIKKPSVDTSSSIARALGGKTTIIEEFYFPPEVIGGICPHVPGSEEETIWNAAAEACDTERVHVVWQAFDSRVWYLAIRSSELASHTGSWCPFAALLPGMKESVTPPVCYTYYGEDIATMMTITEDGLHIYRGTNPIVRAKVERTARELGNAAIIDLVPDKITAFTPVPWYSISLFEERARRILATFSILVSLSLTGLAFLVWLLAGVSLVSSRHDLQEALDRTQSKSLDLMNAVQNLRAAPVREALTKFIDLNEGLLDLNGYLEIYVIQGGKIRWRATVPSNITADRINALGGKTIDTGASGTIIGNQAEIDFEASQAKK